MNTYSKLVYTAFTHQTFSNSYACQALCIGKGTQHIQVWRGKNHINNPTTTPGHVKGYIQLAVVSGKKKKTFLLATWFKLGLIKKNWNLLTDKKGIPGREKTRAKKTRETFSSLVFPGSSERKVQGNEAKEQARIQVITDCCLLGLDGADNKKH